MIEPCEEVKRVEQRYEKALDDMEKHYKDVLDKIRTGIKQLRKHKDYLDEQGTTIIEVLEIIDKYMKGDST